MLGGGGSPKLMMKSLIGKLPRELGREEISGGKSVRPKRFPSRGYSFWSGAKDIYTDHGANRLNREGVRPRDILPLHDDDHRKLNTI